MPIAYTQQLTIENDNKHSQTEVSGDRVAATHQAGAVTLELLQVYLPWE